MSVLLAKAFSSLEVFIALNAYCDVWPPPTADIDLRLGVCVPRALEIHLNNRHLPLPFMLTVLQAPGISPPLLTGYCLSLPNFHLPIAP
ncbi:hypothetical protein AVEN_51646-1 [Araneus ventricosus]|uniref:Secreted protein n=1 Tax=Araneus ventricosus TaxID=182803 RepID=A0A4Y2MV93_ARAVE|nr:hypothetical protein AVEN_51646-1 [Araneus ventricosus]